MSKPQLFCFTYAGGNASFFDVIERDLPEIELVKFEYSGHGTRHKDPLYNCFEELTDDLYPLFKSEYKGGVYGLFGYSMGTIALVELLKKIKDDAELSEPSHVFLAAHEPHTKAELAGYSDDKMDEWVKERTIKFGAVPDKLKENKSFWRVYLPLYRADYSMIGKYRFEELNLLSEISATVFYSETDTPRADMELWKKYFTGSCDLYQFEGNHFFIQEHHVEMAELIMSEMRKEG
ncbi:MAG: thioesterase [Butyrivibrio sp.]|nr:thioesterase [Butyrivibrio sp.]